MTFVMYDMVYRVRSIDPVVSSHVVEFRRDADVDMVAARVAGLFVIG
jgi:hypothetical protein